MNVMFYGGSASGKSEEAEKYALELDGRSGNLIYLATMNPQAGGDSLERIQKHRKMREGRGFFTIESQSSKAGDFIGDILNQVREFSDSKKSRKNTILIEDSGNLIARIIFSGEEIRKEDFYMTILEDFFKELYLYSENLLLVSNDIFLEEIQDCKGKEDLWLKTYCSILGKLNRKLAADFDQVIQVSCGIRQYLKKRS